MSPRYDYLPGVHLSVSSGLQEFDVFPETDVEILTSETFSDNTETLIAEKLDTIIEYQNAINFAIWSLVGLACFVVVAKLLWTVFGKWFFGGV